MIRVYRPASDETLVIVLHEVYHDSSLALADDAVLEREDAERQIHRLLERAPGDRSSRAWSCSSASGSPTPARSTSSAATRMGARWSSR